MARRSRIAAYGAAAVLIVAGALCAALLSGNSGQILALLLIGLGLVGLTSLVFLEVGLSEDRERAREDELASEDQRAREDEGASRRRAEESRRRLTAPRLPRSRGHRRRLK